MKIDDNEGVVILGRRPAEVTLKRASWKRELVVRWKFMTHREGSSALVVIKKTFEIM